MSTFNAALFEQVPLVGILRNYSTNVVEELARLYFDVGFCTLEVTLNTSDAFDSIATLSKEYPLMNIGAGTVCTKNDLIMAKEAGASFVVSPICDIHLIQLAKDLEIAIFPGALTPTEIYRAWKTGADAVKLFPAGSFGQTYLKEIKGPLPGIKIIPVGGVDTNNMQQYFEQGAYGVGLGGGLFQRKEIQQGHYEKINQHFQNIFQHLQTCRNVLVNQSEKKNNL